MRGDESSEYADRGPATAPSEPTSPVRAMALLAEAIQMAKGDRQLSILETLVMLRDELQKK